MSGRTSGPGASGPWQMSRREAWLSAGLVFAVALLVARSGPRPRSPFPIPEDTTYYWGVARNLAEGRGLVSDAIWSYATPARDPVTGEFGFFFPRPAFEIWLPLPSLLGLFPMLAWDPRTIRRPPSCRSCWAPWYRCSPGGSPRTSPRSARLSPERLADAGPGRRPCRGRLAAAGPAVRAASTRRSSFGVAGPGRLPPHGPLVRRPPDRAVDARLIALGLAIGLAALTRNEAIWVGLTWAVRRLCGGSAERGSAYLVRIVGVAGLVAVAVMTPWLDPELARLRIAAPGAGRDERLLDHRLRHLRLERSADPGPVPRRRPARRGWPTGSRASSTTS